MNRRSLIVITFILSPLMGGGLHLRAQTMSDAQVLEYLREALEQGREQQQIASELERRGVTREQALRVRKLYDGGTAPMQGTEQGEARLRAETHDGVRGAIARQQPEAADLARPNGVYGRNVFNSPTLTFEPNANMATPPDYRLGPGDEIIVDIWGASQSVIRRTLSPDGTVSLAELGPVYLSGMTVREAEELLRRQLGRLYSNENNRIKLTLGSSRTIQINIMGEVVQPGTYALSAFATLFHALYRAGGVNELGSLRAVKLVRGGRKIAEADIYDFIMQGRTDGDIRLEEGDVIIVPAYEKLVRIDGNVKRNMRFEMKEGETLATLLDYAGGFEADAYRRSLRIVRQNGEDYEVLVVDEPDFASCSLENGDVVTVGALADRFTNKVEVKGAVLRPDIYALDDRVSTVRDLVERAGGLNEDAFTSRAVLQRQRCDLTGEILALDIGAMVGGRAPDIELRRNDILYIPSIHDLNDSGSVTVAGEVAREGVYPFAENMTLEDLIIQAGGLREAASVMRVDISRRIKEPSGTESGDTIGRMFTFALKDGLVIDGEPGFVLEPYDNVYIRRSPAYRAQQNVRIDGEVLYGGTYALTSRGERLSDLVAKAGGVTGSAYVRGARLVRTADESERKRMNDVIDLLSREIGARMLDSTGYRIEGSFPVGIDLEAALANPGGTADIVVREGDVLTIPKYNNTVKISGAVMMPNTVCYDPSLDVAGYINEAGGYSQHARRSKKFAIYMNGHIARLRSRSLQSVEPGCEIVVPARQQRRNALNSIGQILGLTTSAAAVGTMAAAIASASK